MARTAFSLIVALALTAVTAVSTALVGTGRLRRAGRTVGVVDVDVHDAEGRLVAVGRGCYTTTPDLHARPGASP